MQSSSALFHLFGCESCHIIIQCRIHKKMQLHHVTFQALLWMPIQSWTPIIFLNRTFHDWARTFHRHAIWNRVAAFTQDLHVYNVMLKWICGNQWLMKMLPLVWYTPMSFCALSLHQQVLFLTDNWCGGVKMLGKQWCIPKMKQMHLHLMQRHLRRSGHEIKICTCIIKNTYIFFPYFGSTPIPYYYIGDIGITIMQLKCMMVYNSSSDHILLKLHRVKELIKSF